VTDLSLVERIVAIDDVLDANGVSHAFGGALALAYYTNEVRATKDIDVNVFVPPGAVERVFGAFPNCVAWGEADIDAVQRDGQVRLWWDDTPVDLFFDLDDVHVQAAANARVVPFAQTEIPILGSTELTVFKMLFSRSRDWVDIEAMLEADTVDVAAVEATYSRIMGADDEGLSRLRQLADPTNA
jgi:hypothetical protein